MKPMIYAFALACIAGLVTEAAAVHPWATYAAMLITFAVTYPVLRQVRL
jgi:hypothetical protein